MPRESVERDVRRMERKKRVKEVLEDKFRVELEEVVVSQTEGNRPLFHAGMKIGSSASSIGNTEFKGVGNARQVNDMHGALREKYSKAERELRCKLAALYRLTAHFGWDHLIYSHITAKVPDEKDHYLINPYGIQYSEITASSLIKIDIQGNIVDAGSTVLPVNKAGFKLNSALHQVGQNVVYHTHSHAGTAISAMNCGLLNLCQEALIVRPVSYSSYQGFVPSPAEQQQLQSDLLDNSNVIILENHGLVSVGETIEETFLWMAQLTKACEIQWRVLRCGKDNLHARTFQSKEQFEGDLPVELVCNPNGRQYGKGELEFESYMRMLDNDGNNTGYPYKTPSIFKDQIPVYPSVQYPPIVPGMDGPPSDSPRNDAANQRSAWFRNPVPLEQRISPPNEPRRKADKEGRCSGSEKTSLHSSNDSHSRSGSGSSGSSGRRRKKKKPKEFNEDEAPPARPPLPKSTIRMSSKLSVSHSSSGSSQTGGTSDEEPPSRPPPPKDSKRIHETDSDKISSSGGSSKSSPSKDRSADKERQPKYCPSDKTPRDSRGPSLDTDSDACSGSSRSSRSKSPEESFPSKTSDMDRPPKKSGSSDDMPPNRPPLPKGSKESPHGPDLDERSGSEISDADPDQGSDRSIKSVSSKSSKTSSVPRDPRRSSKKEDSDASSDASSSQGMPTYKSPQGRSKFPSPRKSPSGESSPNDDLSSHYTDVGPDDPKDRSDGEEEGGSKDSSSDHSSEGGYHSINSEDDTPLAGYIPEHHIETEVFVDGHPVPVDDSIGSSLVEVPSPTILSDVSSDTGSEVDNPSSDAGRSDEPMIETLSDEASSSDPGVSPGMEEADLPSEADEDLPLVEMQFLNPVEKIPEVEMDHFDPVNNADPDVKSGTKLLGDGKTRDGTESGSDDSGSDLEEIRMNTVTAGIIEITETQEDTFEVITLHPGQLTPGQKNQLISEGYILQETA